MLRTALEATFNQTFKQSFKVQGNDKAGTILEPSIRHGFTAHVYPSPMNHLEESRRSEHDDVTQLAELEQERQRAEERALFQRFDGTAPQDVLMIS